MISRDPIETFDLPEQCTYDRVAIYLSDALHGPPFYATPFRHDTDGRGYTEPENWVVTPAYREAVAKRASMDIEKVNLHCPPTVEEIEPV